MPKPAQILAQPRQRAFVQEAGDVIGAVGQQFAAADADEQIEKFALDLARRRRWPPHRQGRHGQRQAASDRRAASASRCRNAASGARVSSAASSAYSCARARSTSSTPVVLIVLVIKIGPQDGARDAGHRFDREHTLGGNARPVRHRRLGNADAARKLGDATGSANRFLQDPGLACPFCSLAGSLSFFWREPFEMSHFRMD